MQKKETVEVSVKVPVQIVEFLKALKVDIREYLEESIGTWFYADTEVALDEGAKIFGAPDVSADLAATLMLKCGLREFLKEQDGERNALESYLYWESRK